MRRWLLLLGGPLIWAAHFGAIYAISSISVQIAGDTVAAARALIVASGALAALTAVALMLLAARSSQATMLDRFWRTVSGAGALIAAIAVVWQTLPALAPI